MNHARPVATPRRARVRRWPHDDSVAHLIVRDHVRSPTHQEVDDFVQMARDQGLRAVRTSALFPSALDVFERAGFRPIDELALLRLDLEGLRVDALPRRQTRRLTRRQHFEAAAVDERAFGSPWGNDAASLADIRRATPTHRARRTGGRTIEGFAISGAAGLTGYLQRLAVDPPSQCQGHGSALVADSLRWMHARRLRAAMVNTGIHNEAALALYDRFGFRRLGDHLTISELDLRDQQL